MSEVRWIKIVTNIFDDEKIRFIETLPSGDTMIVMWFKILCLAGKSNASGMLMMTDRIAYTESMLSSIFGRDIKTIQMALKAFEQLEMIEILDDRIYLSNWEKHQSMDKLEAKKEYDRLYQKAKREEKMLKNRTSIARLENDNRSLELEVEKEEELDKEDNSNSNCEAEFFELLEAEFKRPITRNEIDKISHWLEKTSVEYVTHALRQCIMKQVTNVTYLDKVMNTFLNEKKYSLEDLNEGKQNGL